MYSSWPEAFVVSKKKAETVLHILVDEIFPRYVVPLQLLTDNGPENVNKIMKKTLEDLNVHYVTTSFYHRQTTVRLKDFIEQCMMYSLRKLATKNSHEMFTSTRC